MCDDKVHNCRDKEYRVFFAQVYFIETQHYCITIEYENMKRNHLKNALIRYYNYYCENNNLFFPRSTAHLIKREQSSCEDYVRSVNVDYIIVLSNRKFQNCDFNTNLCGVFFISENLH